MQQTFPLIWSGAEVALPYISILVVEVDDQAEGSSSHRLCGDEGVLEGGLPARRNHGAQLQSREVLDVELIILTDKRSRVRENPQNPAGGRGGRGGVDLFPTCG